MRLSFGGDGTFTSSTGAGGAVAATSMELAWRWVRDLFVVFARDKSGHWHYTGSRRYVYLRNNRGQTRLRGTVPHKREAQSYKRNMMDKHGLLVRVLKFYRGEVV